METKYKYGFGRINEVTHGEVYKVNSLDEIDLNKDSGLIVIPRLIGVYQEDEYSQKNNVILNTLEKEAIFARLGKREEIPFDLIGLIYDPTIIKQEVLRDFVKRDALRRIKYFDYSEELPDFYNKNIPNLEIIHVASYDPSDANMALLKRAIEYLELSREDYGLTRIEAISLKVSQSLVNAIENTPHLIRINKDNSSMHNFLDNLGDIF